MSATAARRHVRNAPWGLGVLGAAVAALAVFAPNGSTYSAWNDTTTLGSVPRTFAAVDFKAGLTGKTYTDTTTVGQAVTVALPNDLLRPLADETDKVAVGLGVTGFAQGTQNLAWHVSGAAGTKGYETVTVDLIATTTSACTKDTIGTTVFSGTGLNASTITSEKTLVASTAETSTAPKHSYLCAIFTKPATWNSDYTSTATATATADGETVTSNPAEWNAILTPSADTIDGSGSLTFAWRTYRTPS